MEKHRTHDDVFWFINELSNAPGFVEESGIIYMMNAAADRLRAKWMTELEDNELMDFILTGALPPLDPENLDKNSVVITVDRKTRTLTFED